MAAASAQNRLNVALVRQLVRKDLKVKYQGSSLGFAWSLANPLLQMIVYTFVFSVVMRSEIQKFGIFLMTGLLVWNFFSMGVTGSSMSILSNAGLVKKVPFAHSALPAASIGFAGVQVLLQFAVLFVALLVLGVPPWRLEVLLLIPATVVLLLMTVGLGLFVAATTVRFKDTRHLLEVAMFAWMWLTPIIYPASLVHNQLHEWMWAYYINPMAGVVVSYQRALYGVAYDSQGNVLSASASTEFYLQVLGIGFVVSALVLALGVSQFRRLSQDFAEDL